MTVAMIGICMPTFLLAIVGFIFWDLLEALPVSGWDSLPGDKILPSITLGAAYAAYIARLSRGGMLETLNQDYIRTARAKGLSEFRVVFGHAMQGIYSRYFFFRSRSSWTDWRLFCCRDHLSNSWLRKVLCRSSF